MGRKRKSKTRKEPTHRAKSPSRDRRHKKYRSADRETSRHKQDRSPRKSSRRESSRTSSRSETSSSKRKDKKSKKSKDRKSYSRTRHDDKKSSHHEKERSGDKKSTRYVSRSSSSSSSSSTEEGQLRTSAKLQNIAGKKDLPIKMEEDPREEHKGKNDTSDSSVIEITATKVQKPDATIVKPNMDNMIQNVPKDSSVVQAKGDNSMLIENPLPQPSAQDQMHIENETSGHSDAMTQTETKYLGQNVSGENAMLIEKPNKLTPTKDIMDNAKIPDMSIEKAFAPPGHSDVVTQVDTLNPSNQIEDNGQKPGEQDMHIENAAPVGQSDPVIQVKKSPSVDLQGQVETTKVGKEDQRDDTPGLDAAQNKISLFSMLEPSKSKEISKNRIEEERKLPSGMEEVKATESHMMLEEKPKKSTPTQRGLDLTGTESAQIESKSAQIKLKSAQIEISKGMTETQRSLLENFPSPTQALKAALNQTKDPKERSSPKTQKDNRKATPPKGPVTRSRDSHKKDSGLADTNKKLKASDPNPTPKKRGYVHVLFDECEGHQYRVDLKSITEDSTWNEFARAAKKAAFDHRMTLASPETLLRPPSVDAVEIAAADVRINDKPYPITPAMAEHVMPVQVFYFDQIIKCKVDEFDDRLKLELLHEKKENLKKSEQIQPDIGISNTDIANLVVNALQDRLKNLEMIPALGDLLMETVLLQKEIREDTTKLARDMQELYELEESRLSLEPLFRTLKRQKKDSE